MRGTAQEFATRLGLILLASGMFTASARADEAAPAASDQPFAIEVVDAATGRGVPLVQLETTDRVRYYTDSGGVVAFDDAALMGQDVWFGVSSHGYEFPQESFGIRGVTLRPEPGDAVKLEIRRLNIAERLYRLTGSGIYRDTLRVGRTAPIDQPLLNGKVMGQDSCQTAIYRGKLFWFWGDTVRPGHFLGNFAMAGATSELPEQGGLPPSVGVNLNYFVGPESGFAKPMADVGQRSRPAPLWLDGILTVDDDSGRERLFAHYQRVDGLEPIERGLMLYNDAEERFEPIAQIPLKISAAPGAHPFRAIDQGQEYFYFPVPYPAVRVKADWDSVRDIAAYEAFTCVQTRASTASDGASDEASEPVIDRDSDGKARWRWRTGGTVLEPRQLREMIQEGTLAAEECPFRLCDADSGQPLLLHRSSVCWNAYRGRWVMIGVELMGESMVGEVWISEADRPEGPWHLAKKIATHSLEGHDQDFYNPVQHPYFAEDGGRMIYFEGTYTNTFSGNPSPTPRYNYNQLMYRLDLSDPRLEMHP